MSTRYSLKNRSLIIICILSLVIVIISSMYLAERSKHVEEMEKLEKVTMYLYDLEVQNPLLVLLSFLGQQPVESVNWDEEESRQGLQSIFGELGRGLTNIDYYDPQLVPNNVLSQVHDLQEKVRYMSMSLNREKPLDNKAKVEIMNLSKSVYLCEIHEFTSSWELVESKLECLNEAFGS